MRFNQLGAVGLFLSTTVCANPQGQSEKLHQAFSDYYKSVVNHRLAVIDVQLITWSIGSCEDGFSVRCKISRPVLEHLSRRGSTGAKLLLSAQLLKTGMTSERSVATELLKELASEHKDTKWVASHLKPVMVSLEKTPRKPARSKASQNAYVGDRPREKGDELPTDSALGFYATRDRLDGLSAKSYETEFDSDQELELADRLEEKNKKNVFCLLLISNGPK